MNDVNQMLIRRILFGLVLVKMHSLAHKVDASNTSSPVAPLAETVDKIQKRYRKTRDLKAKFQQIYRDKLYQRTRISFGYLYVRKPGMMRWNYVSPEHKAFISDGKILWVWEPADNQAFRNPLDVTTLSSGLSFLLGTGDLSKTFEITYTSSEREGVRTKPPVADSKAAFAHDLSLWLKLVPKRPSTHYDYLVLEVRPKDHVVVSSMLVDPHSTNRFIFSKLNFNSRIQRNRFLFKPPPATRIVEGNR